jgi:hypothetical protein
VAVVLLIRYKTQVEAVLRTALQSLLKH